MARAKKKKILINLGVALLLVIVVALALPSKKNTAQTAVSGTPKQLSSAAAGSLNIHTYPVDVASSLWVVVNKGRALPAGYVPADLVAPAVPLRLSAWTAEMHLRSDAAAALQTMFAAAKQDGINLMLASGYRSYAEQQTVYAGYVSASGQQQADTFSARPGHSEHQTGLAADIEPLSRACEVDQCFENTPEGRWLAANSYQYGFIIRYPKDAEQLTGYEYEPWHVRYVGNQLASKIYESHQTLEQYFNLPIYLNYPATSYEIQNR